MARTDRYNVKIKEWRFASRNVWSEYWYCTPKLNLGALEQLKNGLTLEPIFTPFLEQGEKPHGFQLGGYSS